MYRVRSRIAIFSYRRTDRHTPSPYNQSQLLSYGDSVKLIVLTKPLRFWLYALGVSLSAVSLSFAHHGDAGRYENEVITVSGTVVALQFMNPHSRLILDVASESSDTVRWHAEFGNPNRMHTEFGWTREILKPGDRVTLTGRRLKSGAPYINLTERAQVTLTDSGTELYRTRDL